MIKNDNKLPRNMEDYFERLLYLRYGEIHNHHFNYVDDFSLILYTRAAEHLYNQYVLHRNGYSVYQILDAIYYAGYMQGKTDK